MLNRNHVTGAGAVRRWVDSALANVARASLACAAAMTLMGATTAVAAEPGNGDAGSFLGIWQGNDPLDGGLITLEVTAHPGDGRVLDLRFSDTFIRACTVSPIANLPPADAVDNRRGIYLAFASPEGSTLRSTGYIPGAGRFVNGVQEIAAGPSDPIKSPAGASLLEVPIFCYRASAPDKPFYAVSAFWRIRAVGDMLVMTGTLFTDDSGTPQLETADGPNSMRFRRLSR